MSGAWGPRPGRLLEAMGLSEAEEQVYRLLIGHYEASAAVVTTATGLPRRQVDKVLASLVQMGLVIRTLSPARRYVVAAPEAAIDLLILRRQQQLEQARMAAGHLLSEAWRGSGDGSRQAVEVVAAGPASAYRQRHLLGAAEGEILGMLTPPIVNPDEEYLDFKRSILSSGVKAQVLYPLSALEAPGLLGFIEAMAALGEEARVMPALPVCMLIVDRDTALVALRRAGDRDHEHLLVHPCALLDALVTLFDQIWARATPFVRGAADTAPRAEQAFGPSAEDRRLLLLFAAGMRDAAIAAQLGVGVRTAERRLSRLMEDLGAETRFAAAVEACRRGWIDLDPCDR